MREAEVGCAGLGLGLSWAALSLSLSLRAFRRPLRPPVCCALRPGEWLGGVSGPPGAQSGPCFLRSLPSGENTSPLKSTGPGLPGARAGRCCGQGWDSRPTLPLRARPLSWAGGRSRAVARAAERSGKGEPWGSLSGTAASRHHARVPRLVRRSFVPVVAPLFVSARGGSATLPAPWQAAAGPGSQMPTSQTWSGRGWPALRGSATTAFVRGLRGATAMPPSKPSPHPRLPA